MDLVHQRRCVYITRRRDVDLQRSLAERGWAVTVVESPEAALKLLNKGRHWGGLLDMSSGYGAESYAALEDCLQQPAVGWVMSVSARQLQLDTVRRFIAKHCFDYVTNPVRPERTVDAIGHAYGMVTLDQMDCPPVEQRMIGDSPPMQHLRRAVAKVASSAVPVFIRGESGTGKELTAAAIHQQSERCEGPFVAINCGAIPHSLVQSELYGYEKGAFTGANQQRVGRIEAAHGGTLFLDEIGDLPMESQASLLRFLQEGQIERLGGRDPVQVDVRVISATHVDIEEAVANGRFRSDLYHRLCVLRIDEPPLRERGADIELLAHCMLDRFRGDSPRRITGFSSRAIHALYSYEWPGNVRELINRVRRAIVMAEGRVITPEDLELPESALSRPITLAEARCVAEEAAIQQALRRNSNRLNDAAQELGISRVTLYRLMDNMRSRKSIQDSGAVRPAA